MIRRNCGIVFLIVLIGSAISGTLFAFDEFSARMKALGEYIKSDSSSRTQYSGVDLEPVEETVIERDTDFHKEARITGGVGYTFGERIGLNLYTPDLSRLSEWELEGRILF